MKEPPNKEVVQLDIRWEDLEDTRPIGTECLVLRAMTEDEMEGLLTQVCSFLELAILLWIKIKSNKLFLLLYLFLLILTTSYVCFGYAAIKTKNTSNCVSYIAPSRLKNIYNVYKTW